MVFALRHSNRVATVKKLAAFIRGDCACDEDIMHERLEAEAVAVADSWRTGGGGDKQRKKPKVEDLESDWLLRGWAHPPASSRSAFPWSCLLIPQLPQFPISATRLSSSFDLRSLLLLPLLFLLAFHPLICAPSPPCLAFVSLTLFRGLGPPNLMVGVAVAAATAFPANTAVLAASKRSPTELSSSQTHRIVVHSAGTHTCTQAECTNPLSCYQPPNVVDSSHMLWHQYTAAQLPQSAPPPSFGCPMSRSSSYTLSSSIIPLR